MKQKHLILLVLAGLFIVGASAQVLALYPEAITDYTQIDSQRRPAATPINITLQAGNITWIRVNFTSITRRWAGLVGNVSGQITLDDASNDTFYSWNLSNISGQMYASQNCSIDWNYISTQNDCTVDEALTGSTASDRVSTTYTPSNNTLAYQVINLQVNASSVCTAYPYVNDTAQTGQNLFENTILTAGTVPNGNQSIYVCNFENAVAGFDTANYDFQCLLPVNKTSGFTTYCLYAELD